MQPLRLFFLTFSIFFAAAATTATAASVNAVEKKNYRHCYWDYKQHKRVCQSY